MIWSKFICGESYKYNIWGEGYKGWGELTGFSFFRLAKQALRREEMSKLIIIKMTMIINIIKTCEQWWQLGFHIIISIMTMIIRNGWSKQRSSGWSINYSWRWSEPVNNSGGWVPACLAEEPTQSEARLQFFFCILLLKLKVLVIWGIYISKVLVILRKYISKLDL